jgi:hypothetical protein
MIRKYRQRKEVEKKGIKTKARLKEKTQILKIH